MTFEERIDRLTERQEALAQSLELLTADVQKHDQLIGQILEATARNNETVANLALIARVHSDRLQRLEEAQKK